MLGFSCVVYLIIIEDCSAYYYLTPAAPKGVNSFLVENKKERLLKN
jgi:hypothetical protein